MELGELMKVLFCNVRLCDTGNEEDIWAGWHEDIPKAFRECLVIAAWAAEKGGWKSASGFDRNGRRDCSAAFNQRKEREKEMTTQQENYINSRLEAYRRGLEEKDGLQIEGDVQAALEEAEQKERERIEGMIAAGRIDWSDEECEAHMKKFLEEAEGELWDRFKAVCDEENEMLLEEYLLELERELAAETE